MVGVIAFRLHGGVGFAFGGEAVVHADQDHFLKAHVVGKLQTDVCDRGAFPNPVPHISGKFW